MTTKIYIECDSAEELPAARAVLEKHPGCQNVLHEGGANLSVLVHDSRDAEEEITNLLNDAGVTCYVHDGN